ncbi:hypothetical protein K1719_046798 [Acacia pycnantha]|nr:hypothetical protein K1719_046798 [Acacia pycnantha]
MCSKQPNKLISVGCLYALSFVDVSIKMPLQQITTNVTLIENNVVIYKFVQDLHFFVTSGDDENMLILTSVLQGFFDAVTYLLRSNVDKRNALENLDLFLLCLDEIVDGGIDADGPLSEQTLTQAWATAREHLTRTFLK